MSDRTYRLILGILLLISLYFDLRYFMLALVTLPLAEGVTNLRVPRVVGMLRNSMGGRALPPESASPCSGSMPTRFGWESERVWRLMVGTVLLVSVVLFSAKLWFIPWFIGFVLFGAGLSGVCPGLYGLKMLGFK